MHKSAFCRMTAKCIILGQGKMNDPRSQTKTVVCSSLLCFWGKPVRILALRAGSKQLARGGPKMPDSNLLNIAHSPTTTPALSTKIKLKAFLVQKQHSLYRSNLNSNQKLLTTTAIFCLFVFFCFVFSNSPWLQTKPRKYGHCVQQLQRKQSFPSDCVLHITAHVSGG